MSDKISLVDYGLYWIKRPNGEITVAQWTPNSDLGNTTSHFFRALCGKYGVVDYMDGYEVLGPCFTPDEVEEIHAHNPSYGERHSLLDC